MEKVGLEWWPCRGTLIALLRHGRRSAVLASGRVSRIEGVGVLRRHWLVNLTWNPKRDTNTGPTQVIFLFQLSIIGFYGKVAEGILTNNDGC